MNLPTIAIVNFSSLDDQIVQDAIRAVNRQVVEDFMPIWGCGRICKLHEAAFQPNDEESLAEEQLRAESVIYLVNESSLEGALGYHSINSQDLPIGFVFVELGDWTITLSHEVLELIVDPTVNIYVPGPDPRSNSQEITLFHSYEVCDAVERISYRIDGIEVSNFVTPNYFTVGDVKGSKNDFLGTDVSSFGLLEGCHLGVIHIENLEWETIQQAESLQSKAAKSRFEQYARAINKAKPPRPSDEVLGKILHAYNENTPKHCHQLNNLTGITRTSRYRAGALRMKNR